MATTSSGSAQVTLPNDTSILITRQFAAPARNVYKAWTTPELVRRWWCGQRGVVTSIEIDLRVGGRWRYVMEADGGFEVAFNGEYREIVADERLVHTEIFEGAPGSPALTTVTFTESEGRTVVHALTEHTSQLERDLHLESGMEGGMQEAMDLLEQVALSLA